MVIKQWHPAAEAFPLMQGDAFRTFADDIRVHGVLKPLEYYDGDRWPEFKGFGIDGRNRQKACGLLNLDPPVKALTDADVGDSLTSYIASVNVSRRHLSSGQAAVVALELEKQFAVENAANKEAGLKEGREKAAMIRAVKSADGTVPQQIGELCAAEKGGKGKVDDSVPQQIGELCAAEKGGKKNIDTCTSIHSNESAQQAAVAVGTNRQYVSYAKTIAKQSTPLLGLVRDDRLLIRHAISALKQRAAHPEAFAALEEGQIDIAQFRDWCFLKAVHSDLWNEFRQGRMTCEEAIAKAKERKAAGKKSKTTEADLAVTTADVKRRVESAYKELGDCASVAQIAAKAGVRAKVAEEIIFGKPNEDKTIDADAKETQAPRDRLNRPLDQELVPVFLDLAEFDAVIELLGQCRAEVGKLAARPAGTWINSQPIMKQLEHFQEHLKENAPFCVCPSCSGTGHGDERHAKDCATCHGKGFICEGDFQDMNQELRRTAERYKR